MRKQANSSKPKSRLSPLWTDKQQESPRDVLIGGGGSVVEPKKVRLTTMVGAEAANLARNAVYWTPRLTMSALIERAIVREVQELEKERGKPFPQRERELPSGRPYLGADEGGRPVA
jgi:hypothetical protein